MSLYLPVAVQSAKAGGKILMARLGKLKPSELSRKGKHDWVTAADRASEAAIIRTIKRTFPTHTFRAEESAPTAAAAEYQWVIDPLDGTVNYIHRFPMFCVSVALMKQGRLEVGVIFDPSRNELFTAQRGRGAWLNGRRIHVSPSRTFADTMLATGFPFRAQRYLDLYLTSFRRIFLKTGFVRRAGSAALDLAYTACGRFDGFWEMSLSAWDMAAGALLVEEAGGKVSDFFGRADYLDNGHIAAGTRVVHKNLVKILTPIFKGKL